MLQNVEITHSPVQTEKLYYLERVIKIHIIYTVYIYILSYYVRVLKPERFEESMQKKGFHETIWSLSLCPLLTIMMERF